MLGTLFVPDEGPDAERQHIVKTMDELIDDPAVHLEARLTEATTCLQTVYASCEADAKDVTDAIYQMCRPQGWELHKDTLLEQPDVCKAMLGNGEYQKIGPAVDILTEMKKNISSMSNDGAGPVINAMVWKKMKEAISHGTSTVAATFAVWQIHSAIPAITNDAARAVAVDNLKISLQKRLPILHLGKSIADGLEALKQPKGGKA